MSPSNDATLAYQGYAQGIDRKLVASLNQFAATAITPDLTILIDCPVELGLGRARQRIQNMNKKNNQDRMEEKHVAFHQKVRQGYLDIAKHSNGRVHIIDGSKDPSAVHQDIRSVVLQRLEA